MITTLRGPWSRGPRFVERVRRRCQTRARVVSARRVAVRGLAQHEQGKAEQASSPSPSSPASGITLANISLFVFQKLISGGTEAGIPYWVFGSFMLGAVCSIGSVLVSVLRPRRSRPPGGARRDPGQEGRGRHLPQDAR